MVFSGLLGVFGGKGLFYRGNFSIGAFALAAVMFSGYAAGLTLDSRERQVSVSRLRDNGH